MTNSELWQSVLAQIQFSISRTNFITWFKNTEITSKENGEVVILVENSFAKEWLCNKYYSIILKILRELDPDIKSINFLINPQKSSTAETINFIKKDKDIDSFIIPSFELTINKETNLNSRYNFENFIVGGFNQLAQAAAWAVSENPGLIYNPLFIYSNVGLGKTHLIQATGNRIAKVFPQKKVKYIPCESFVSGVVDGIRNQKIDVFKKEFKNVDVLIMDDIQFFTGKDKSQEEFFHIFNLLYQSQKQIIISSDQAPNTIPGIEERLRSRFSGGMITDIGIPDTETKIAILKTKANEKNIPLKNDVLDYISSNIKTNIRELEGILNKLVFFKNFYNKTPDINDVKKLFENLINPPRKKINFKEVLQVISKFYDLKIDDLLSDSRRKEIVKPRQMAMYILREELKESFPTIGRRFKGKDHTTVIYSWNKVNKEIKQDNDLLSELNSIKQRLYNSVD